MQGRSERFVSLNQMQEYRANDKQKTFTNVRSAKKINYLYNMSNSVEITNAEAKDLAKQIEDLKLQNRFLVQKSASLQQENQKLQKDNENKSLVTMSPSVKNTTAEAKDLAKVIEDLKLQNRFLIQKSASLQQENQKLQKDNEQLVDKNKELEDKIMLVERGNQVLRTVCVEIRAEIKTVQQEKAQLEEQCDRRIKNTFHQQSCQHQDVIRSNEFFKHKLAAKTHELHEVSTMNDSLSAALYSTRVELAQARKEIEEKGTSFESQLENMEQLKRDLAVKTEENQQLLRTKSESIRTIRSLEKENHDLLVKTETEKDGLQETIRHLEEQNCELLVQTQADKEELQQTIRCLEDKNQDMQEHWVPKKPKKSLFNCFFSRSKNNNKNQAEEVTEERPEQQEPETKPKKKSFWCWS